MRRTMLVTLFLFIGGLLGRADAADIFITIGGGPEPTNNQVSLEKSVQFFQRTIARQRDDQPRHEIYFADGRSAQRDLQYRDPEAMVSASSLWLSTLAGNEHLADLAYRDHQVEPIAGPARKAFLNQMFSELAQTMSAGDRLILYVTAHGGPAEEEEVYDYGMYGEMTTTATNSQDTTIALWNDETLSMTEFSDWLDRFGPEVEIVVVMAQCYSGGFAHAIYHDGNARLGLSGRPRCGFFSQRHDRPSAGCTPEILESEYQDYSTFFWAALGGRNLSGQTVKSADYDQSGDVTFAEAHAYALITSETLDIPLKTSGVLLRRYAKVGEPVDETSEEDTPVLSDAVATFFGGDSATQSAPTLVYDQAALLTRQSTIAGVLELATADQRAVVEQLATWLKMPHEVSLQRVRNRFRRAGTTLQTQRESMAVKGAEYALIRSQLNESVKQQYPELRAEGYTRIMTELTTVRADEFLEYLGGQPQTEVLTRLADELLKAAEKVSRREIQEARLGRLLMTLEDIILEENLPQTAPQELIDDYGRMLRMEQGTLAAR